MRVLMLGGTRFLGRRLAEALASAGHELTLLSRREGGAPPGTRQVCAERDAGLAALKGSRFELVLDFICYDGHGPEQVATGIVLERYLLISTTWLPRLWNGDRADEPCPAAGTPRPGLSAATREYLDGKRRAEEAVAALRSRGRDAAPLRLPIVLGAGDHTGRLDFYRRRFADGGPVIAVDGAHNLAQIAEVEDLALNMAQWLGSADLGRFPVWEALPGEGCPTRAILARMATAAGATPELVEVSAAELAQTLPAYLEQEPFWRESALAPTEANLYAALGRSPAAFGHCPPWPAGVRPADELRPDELRFLAHRHAH